MRKSEWESSKLTRAYISIEKNFKTSPIWKYIIARNMMPPQTDAPIATKLVIFPLKLTSL